MMDRVTRWIPLVFLLSTISGCAYLGLEAEPTRTPEPVEAAPPPEPEAEQEAVAVTASRLNMRAGNSSKSKILGVLKKDETVTVLGRERGWLNVQTHSGTTGWVAERYTRPAGSVAAAAPAQRTPSPPAAPAAKAPPAQTPQVGSFSQEDAVALHNRYRKALADGDFNAFLSCIYEAPGEAEAGPSIKEATSEEFNQLKEFLFELTPDLAKARILRFYSNKEAALMVIQNDLENKEYVTLSALKFINREGAWKVFPKFYDNAFPRQDSQADQAAISKELASNPELQLAIVMKEAQGTAAPSTPTPPPGKIPASAGKAEGQLVINGVSHPLQYAYAYVEPSLFDKAKTNTVVVLSNMALDDEAVENWARRSELEAAGKLHCVELTINENNRVVSRKLRDSAFDASPSGVSSEESFVREKTERGVIAGKAFTAREDDFFGVTFEYRAAFRANIRPMAKEGTQKKAAPQQSELFKDTPEHKAIVKMLKAEGKTDILQTAHSVSMSSQDSFARVGIAYEKGGHADIYLFKEAGNWVAYSRLPTHKDFPEVFSQLAMEYCKVRYKDFMGFNFIDDSHKNKDPKKRIINVNCGELINKEWKYHRLSMAFEYDAEQGWAVTGAEAYRKPEAPPKKSVSQKSKTPPKESVKKKPPTSLQEAMKMSDLQIAIMSGSTQGEARALTLIKSGADVSFKNKIGDTPLHTAVNTRPPSVNIVQALLDAGAAVDASNEYGYTPLHNLAQNAVNTHVPVAKLLIGAGADVNRRDPYGMTPLYHMTIHGLGCKGLKVAQALIDAGADVNSNADNGTSVLAAAQKNNCDALAALLVSAGAL
jgi:hypothetical protein